ncbi:MAG TPA: hypothetical protein VIH93_09685, partial [Thermoanaerobaculia bacterium]
MRAAPSLHPTILTRAAVLAAATILALSVPWLAAAAGSGAAGGGSSSVHLPWRQAGLSERQAAAHLLNRFAFGPRPGEIDAVVAMGLD